MVEHLHHALFKNTKPIKVQIIYCHPRMTLFDKKGIILFTFMIYLNQNLEGGATTFFDRRKKGGGKMNINRIIHPKTGMGLAFDHLLFHEGSKVKKGVKYVLRSDLIYKKK